MRHYTTHNVSFLFSISALCCSLILSGMNESNLFIPVTELYNQINQDSHDSIEEQEYLDGTISYELAKEDDIPDLIAIMDNYSQDDRNKLLVLPEPFRTQSLASAIEKKRIFVARDTRLDTEQNIVSFVKVFVIKNDEEKNRILGDELRIIPTATHEAPDLIECGYYKANYNENQELDEVYDFSNDIGKTKMRFSPRRSARLFDTHDRQTILYLGSAYTIAKKGSITYRGHGISTILEKKALKRIHGDILTDIREKDSTDIIMLYGLVEANKETLLHARDFMATMQYIRASLKLENFNLNSQAKLDYYMYRAYKPAFTVTENQELQILPDDHADTKPGYGCLLRSSLYDYRKKKSTTH